MPPLRQAALASSASTAAVTATTTALVVSHYHLRMRKPRAVSEPYVDLPRDRDLVSYEQKNFQLDDLDDATCIRLFRFNKDTLREMLYWLRLDFIEYRNRYKPSPELALCMTLYRLSAPNRYMENLSMFGRSESYQSSVFNDVIHYLNHRYAEKLFFDRRLHYGTLRRYATAIEEESSFYGIWGFVDGTQRLICRPNPGPNGEDLQREFYSGYKKGHTIKFQGIIAPDGIICHLAGPYEGRHNDWKVWEESGLTDKLRTVHEEYYDRPLDENDQKLHVYGDSAYFSGFGVFGAYKAPPNGELTRGEKDFNREMSTLRIAIEHGFAKVMNLWGYVGYRPGMRIGKSPVGSYYRVAVLFTNCHTCVYGSQVGDRFPTILPPSLEEYLQM